MSPAEVAPSLLRPHLGRAVSGYDGKTVEFLCELGGRLLLLIGQFTFKSSPDVGVLAIQYSGKLYFEDSPVSEYVFLPTQAHLRSTVPATRAGAKVDFLMEKPFLPRDWVKADLDEDLQIGG